MELTWWDIVSTSLTIALLVIFGFWSWQLYTINQKIDKIPSEVLYQICYLPKVQQKIIQYLEEVVIPQQKALELYNVTS